MKSRELLFDLNFKKANIDTDETGKNLILSKAELDSLCYTISREVNKLEQNLFFYSNAGLKDNSAFIKILFLTQNIGELIKRVYFSLNNPLALGLMFSDADKAQLKNLGNDFNLAEQAERFNSLKKQISYLSYSSNFTEF